MAVTSGHGNPNWAREEVILALDLYFDCKGRPPTPRDARVRELSEVLRAFPHHAESARRDTFRNADGVAFKLQNLRQVATGKGLGNVSRTDKYVWEEFGSDPARVKQLAQLIRAGVKVAHEFREQGADYEVFAEGRVVTEAHLRRERNPKLRSKLLAARRAIGPLTCDVCARQGSGLDVELAQAIFEAHHVLPLSAGEVRATRLADMALLCACCHRQMHKLIAMRRQWLTVADLRSVLGCAE
jgi:5-methylcytosine-specific restriction protein A